MNPLNLTDVKKLLRETYFELKEVEQIVLKNPYDLTMQSFKDALYAIDWVLTKYDANWQSDWEQAQPGITAKELMVQDQEDERESPTSEEIKAYILKRLSPLVQPKNKLIDAWKLFYKISRNQPGDHLAEKIEVGSTLARAHSSLLMYVQVIQEENVRFNWNVYSTDTPSEQITEMTQEEKAYRFWDSWRRFVVYQENFMVVQELIENSEDPLNPPGLLTKELQRLLDQSKLANSFLFRIREMFRNNPYADGALTSSMGDQSHKREEVVVKDPQALALNCKAQLTLTLDNWDGMYEVLATAIYGLSPEDRASLAGGRGNDWTLFFNVFKGFLYELMYLCDEITLKTQTETDDKPTMEEEPPEPKFNTDQLIEKNQVIEDQDIPEDPELPGKEVPVQTKESTDSKPPVEKKSGTGKKGKPK